MICRPAASNYLSSKTRYLLASCPKSSIVDDCILCNGLEEFDQRACLSSELLQHIEIPYAVKVIKDEAIADCYELT